MTFTKKGLGHIDGGDVEAKYILFCDQVHACVDL